ncbi:MAG: DUF1273 family protein [Clostridia bacterium]|nr:DUF1273 family protein [Clostridia bacterium]
MSKKCCFIGHRTIKATAELIKRIDTYIETLIKEQGVSVFLFGSRSQFDDLCHERVTKMQEEYPDIKRIAFTCRSEYACLKNQKEDLECIARAVTKRDITYKAYDGVQRSERVYRAGGAAYVERNQEMINASDYCVFYYDPYYAPPKRKRSKCDLAEYQPKSGTQLAFEYAYQKKRGEKKLTVVNLWRKKEESDL